MAISNGTFIRGNDAEARKAFPRFFLDNVQDQWASHNAGRPIFKQVERVEFVLPGNPLSRPVKNVDDQIRQEYAREYDAFKAGREMALEGTPLEEWPILNRGQVEELKHLKIMTVEQCAALDDASIQRIGMGGRHLVERAKAFLDDAERMKIDEALRAKNDLLESQVASLSRQVSELGSIVQGLQSENINLRSVPNPVSQVAPMQTDPFALAIPPVAQQAPPASSLDSLAPSPRRRGRPPKNPIAA